ncbi:MAG TPA: carboxypeptidase-like regulatory domain-containing protein [Terriglobales bacterium]|nr:carboxypeptidase-like regulatory domain-containing protein [Terriglobales bacterium]
MLRFRSGLIVLALIGSGGALSGQGQTSPSTPLPNSQPAAVTSACDSLSAPRLSGGIRGDVVDETGAVIAGAQVRLTGEGQSQPRDVLTGADGQFCFTNIAPGPFQLSITWEGFETQIIPGILHPGEFETEPQIVMKIAAANTDVQVGLTPSEVAEEQIKVEEKQRVLGVIPNFYVTYIPNAVPLSPKQKFQLAWKTVIDPVTFGMVGAIAGIEQAQNHFIGYGQGFKGYAKRYGAGYADTVSGTYIGGAILPWLLKQDPRYFYKGTGSIRSRFLYAMATSLICKGDNRRWQPNYSNILGSLASGGISNIYYPAQDRDGAELTFENAAIGIAATALTNVMQEFIIRKLTPKTPSHDPTKP